MNSPLLIKDPCSRTAFALLLYGPGPALVIAVVISPWRKKFKLDGMHLVTKRMCKMQLAVLDVVMQ